MTPQQENILEGLMQVQFAQETGSSYFQTGVHLNDLAVLVGLPAATVVSEANVLLGLGYLTLHDRGVPSIPYDGAKATASALSWYTPWKAAKDAAAEAASAAAVAAQKIIDDEETAVDISDAMDRLNLVPVPVAEQIATKSPNSHGHIISEVTGLQALLDSKAQALGADDNYVTDAEKVKLSNTIGTNTGDQTLPTDATLSTSDITTNNVSATKHGFAPKFPNNTTTFLRGDGTWDIPTASVAYTLVATLASDQATGANVTPVTLTGLVFTYAANSKYRIHLYGGISAAAATTGCGFQFDTSSVITTQWLHFTHQLAATGTLSGGSSIADDVSAGVSSGLPSTAIWSVMGSGIIITGANTGTAQLRFRSETTAVITCRAGTTIVVEKIA